MKRVMPAVGVPGLVLALMLSTQIVTLVGQQQHIHTDAREQFRVEPQRVEEGPVVDGILDDAVWQRAAVIDNFTQQEPEEGKPATERTEVLLLYDAAQLYIGVRAHDSSSNGIIATEM